MSARPLRALRPDQEAPEARVARVTHALSQSQPHYSARRVLTLRQLLEFSFALPLALTAFYFYPRLAAGAVLAVLLLLYLASFLFKSVLFLVGLPRRRERPVPLPDAALPLYTILVPLFREGAALPALLGGLERLDYPPEKLDIKFLIEADDRETAEALDRLRLPPMIEILEVPPFAPRTKPKALAYGLTFARGAFIVVYDAEDQPEPDQLRRALARFQTLGRDTACLQARLNVFNARENWLCRLYAVDYCLWFDFLLPGLERLRAPLPLGGTSNHFRRDALIAVGGWDPFNVTEDADLGIRLAREGFRVRTLASTTFEEAPTTLNAWLAQRARWIKGYMQTYLVHMRDRRRLTREVGSLGAFSLDFFLLGTVVAGLVNPFLWGLFVLWLTTGEGILGGQSGTMLLGLSRIGLVGGNALLIVLCLLAPLRRGWFGLVLFALSAPLYWLLISLAAWRGLASLVLHPFHWTKTPHGLTRFEARAGVGRRKDAAA